MLIKEKEEKALIAYNQLKDCKDYQTYLKCTSYNIFERDFNDEVNISSIIKKLSSIYLEDAILLDKHEKDIVSIKYVCVIKGNIYLIHHYPYSNNLKYVNNKKVQLSFKNNEEVILTNKENPIYRLNKFYKRFLKYLKLVDIKYVKDSIKKVIIFTHDDVNIDEQSISLFNKDAVVLYKSNFEEYFKNCKKNRKTKYDKLIVPSYDKGYNVNKGFFNLAIIDETFFIDRSKYSVSDFEYVVFNDERDNRDLLVRYDKREVNLLLDKKKIKTNDNNNLQYLDVDFIYFNHCLHYLRSPEFKLILEKRKQKKINRLNYVFLIAFIFFFIIGTIILTLYFVNKDILHLISMCVFYGLDFISLLSYLFTLLKQKEIKMKIEKLEFYIDENSKYPQLNDDITLVDGEIQFKDDK